MRKSCPDTFRGERCERPVGHDGFHRRNDHVWASRDGERPEWLRRGVGKDLTGATR